MYSGVQKSETSLGVLDPIVYIIRALVCGLMSCVPSSPYCNSSSVSHVCLTSLTPLWLLLLDLGLLLTCSSLIFALCLFLLSSFHRLFHHFISGLLSFVT